MSASSISALVTGANIVRMVCACFSQYSAESRHSCKTLSSGVTALSLFALEMAFTVNLKIVSRFSDFKDFGEIVGARHFVSFARSKSGGNILDTFRSENNRFAVSTRACVHVVIHEALDFYL
jgi:hypothetical protein